MVVEKLYEYVRRQKRYLYTSYKWSKFYDKNR